ncbi:MAG TPA: response regulator transcription factor [Actinomycetota bacterium]|nr:response regulator transcription factor [Actinomycetota bacterium]
MEDAGLAPVDVHAHGSSALSYLETHAPDVVLLDIGLPDQSGFAVGAEMLDRWPRLRIVALTALDDPRAVDEAHALGFRGFLSKDIPVHRFVTSVLAVIDGQTDFPFPRSRRRSAPRPSLLGSRLTPREHEVLGLLVDGTDSSGIARQLGISRNTVRTHVQSILTKLQVHTRLEAATFAVRHGLVPIGGGYAGERAGDRSP